MNVEMMEAMQALAADKGISVDTLFAALADADFAHNRAAQMRRQLVRLEELVDMLDSVFGIVRNGIEGMPDRLERELSLKPEEVDLVQRLGSDILEAMVARIEEAELRERDIADIAPENRLLI